MSDTKDGAGAARPSGTAAAPDHGTPRAKVEHGSVAVDFSTEDWDGRAHAIAPGCWVASHKHGAGMNPAFQINNRTFVFRLKNKAHADTLVVFGIAGHDCIDACKELEESEGLKVGWIVGNGGAHHLFLRHWYIAFPTARVLVPAKRVPFTANGIELQREFASRWELMHGPKPKQLIDEFGAEIDVVIFDQLRQYKDETHRKAGGVKNSDSTPVELSGVSALKFLAKVTKDTEQETDEVVLYHRATGLVVGGHNFQFIFRPKGYKAPERFKLQFGGGIMSVIMNKTLPPGDFKSTLEIKQPVTDPAAHAAEWEAVLEWPVIAEWTTAHNPPQICGPAGGDRVIKQLIRESLKRSGELDPTGAALLINRPKSCCCF